MLYQIVEGLYIVLSFWLALYGFNALYLTLRYWRVRHQKVDPPLPPPTWPKVTIQLPIYNERHVVRRLLNAVARIEYPRGELEIQVLDDSTDDTAELAEALVRKMRDAGLNISYIHRTDRVGYKAGALANGLRSAQGEFIAVFDADFVPATDFLRATIPFFQDAGVGCVQTRWKALNPYVSSFTRALSVALDGHYIVEKTAQHRSGYLINFNGSAGIWRRSAIDSTGGWQSDTLTEDLDLSLRAQMAGWRFLYLPDVVSQTELPFQIEAFRLQQARWAKGTVQTFKKLFGKLWLADLPLMSKIEASLMLTTYLIHPLLIVAAGLTAILSLGGSQLPRFLPLLGISALGIPSGLISAQLENGRPWRQKLLDIVQMSLIISGLTATSARSVFEAFLGINSPFRRTPKFETDDQWIKSDYSLPIHVMVWAECVTLVLYFVAVAATYSRAYWGAVSIIALPILGQFYLLYLSLRQIRRLQNGKNLERKSTPNQGIILAKSNRRTIERALARRRSRKERHLGRETSVQ